MAFAASMVWEARSTGNAANGGGFDPVSGTPGTDYSVQDSAQIAYTDLVIDAVTNTKCTSAGNPFTSAHVGNVINVTGGTGFTVQRVQIMSVAAGAATVDKSLGTLSSTGGTGNLGGGLATIQAAHDLMIAGNTCYVKGTHTVTSTISITLNATNDAICRFVGYATTRTLTNTDTKPIITTATNSVNLLTGNGSSYVSWANLQFTNSAATKGSAIVGVTAGSAEWRFYRCKFGDVSGGNNLLNVSNATASTNYIGCRFHLCEMAYCTGAGFSYSLSGATVNMFGCYIHHCGAEAIIQSSTSVQALLENCIVTNNVGRGIYQSRVSNPNTSVFLTGCTFANNGTAQVAWGVTTGMLNIVKIINCVFYGAGAGTNLNVATANKDSAFIMLNNAFGGSGSFSNTNCTTGEGAITLTGDPFTNAAAFDYSLNNTAGAGAACRSVGTPDPFPGGLTANKQDLGAAQAAPSASGGLLRHPGMTGGINA